jgi:hypothetical protein
MVKKLFSKSKNKRLIRRKSSKIWKKRNLRLQNLLRKLSVEVLPLNLVMEEWYPTPIKSKKSQIKSLRSVSNASLLSARPQQPPGTLGVLPPRRVSIARSDPLPPKQI